MKLVASLVSLGRSFSGRGTNHEGEDFAGRLELQPLLDGKALMLTYTVTRVDGVHLHSEVTLLATDGKGRPCLWPVMEELPVVLPHPEVGNVKLHDGTQAIVFASGPRDEAGVFREEITIEVRPEGQLRYAHGWALPGGDFDARSSCVLGAVED